METCCPIRRFDLTTEEWTPIVAPVACTFYAIFLENTEVLRCSNPENAGATWHKTSGFALIAPPQTRRQRWQEGEVVTYLKAISSPTQAAVEFIPRG